MLVDKEVLIEARVKKRCLATGWIDYQKSYDMVPHDMVPLILWIVVLETMKVADNVKHLLCGSMSAIRKLC